MRAGAANSKSDDVSHETAVGSDVASGHRGEEVAQLRLARTGIRQRQRDVLRPSSGTPASKKEANLVEAARAEKAVIDGAEVETGSDDKDADAGRV